jgi:hypothetical protein
VAPAARFAEALRTATEQGAKAVRERRPPTWDAVRAALHTWEPPGPDDAVTSTVAHRSATLMLEALEDFSEALATPAPPMTVDGTTQRAERGDTSGPTPAPTGGPRNPGGPATTDPGGGPS